MDLDTREVRVHDADVRLTVTEMNILAIFLQAQGRVLTRGRVLDMVREEGTHITERTIDTHVRRIRVKLRPHGIQPIETVHGLGYKAARLPASGVVIEEHDP